MSTDPPSKGPPSPRLARRHLVWLSLLLIPVVEVIGFLTVQARVPGDADWREASAFVRGEYREADLITVVPAWADPVLRQHLGDVITLAQAGHHDLASFERLWVLSIRGHRSAEAPDREPDLTRSFGEVTVRRWDLGDSPVLFDFVEELTRARVTMTEGGTASPCELRRLGPRGGSGLFQGPMAPAERFICDMSRPWLWVGATVNEDLDIRPRRCVWNHPLGTEPIRTTFTDVPLGSHLVLYASLFYIHERELTGAEAEVVVRIDGEEIARLIHRDGDGDKRLVALTGGAGRRGDVTFEVTTPRPYHRSLCWAATTREGPRAED